MRKACQFMSDGVDQYDDGRRISPDEALKPLNIKKKPKRHVAVALQEAEDLGDAPSISAAGRGVLAEKILRMAFDNGIKVREDSALAEMLATVELE